MRGGVSQSYVRALLSLHFTKMNRIMGGPNAPWEIIWASTSGTSVNLARDELADLAIKQNYDVLAFWDIDLGVFDPQIMLSMFARLFSHDVDGVVAAQYVGHKFISGWHGAAADKEPVPRPDGLMEMGQIPIGFSTIPVSCLKKIREYHKHREYAIRETGDAVPKGKMFEYFPIGINGPCSDRGKIERLCAIIKDENPTVASFEVMDEIRKILWDDRYETNFLLGEDYGFCKMAREAGVKLYIDNNLIVPHESSVRLPVRNQDLITELGHEWRLHNDAKPEEVKELLRKLAPMLSADMP